MAAAQPTPILTKGQQAALHYVQSYAERAHEDAVPKLERKLAALLELEAGHDVCSRVLDYVKHNLQMTVFFDLSKTLGPLAKDTHYRNQFETKSSNALLDSSTRRKAEKDVFNSAYEDSAAEERPKYGCLNITGHQNAFIIPNRPAVYNLTAQYGEAFLVLKPEVRDRVTISDRDSLRDNRPQHPLGTLRYSAHILLRFTDEELLALVRAVENTPSQDWGFLTGYQSDRLKEVQIHGPIRLHIDVAELVIHTDDRTHIQLATEFGERHRVQYRLISVAK